jgi:hypothetical protein
LVILRYLRNSGPCGELGQAIRRPWGIRKLVKKVQKLKNGLIVIEFNKWTKKTLKFLAKVDGFSSFSSL